MKPLVRCRKDATLCRRAEEGAKCFYDKNTFTPEEVRKDETIVWRCDQFFNWRQLSSHSVHIRFKEIKNALWRRGGRRRMLRLIVIAPTGYRLHAKGALLYRQPAYLLTDDLETPVEKLISAYLRHWQIEVNHREEKDAMGVANAQVRNPNSVPRQPAFVVAIYSILLLAALKA